MSSCRAFALVPGLPRLDLAATEREGAGWGGNYGEAFACGSVSLCGAHLRMCTCVRPIHSLTHSVTFVFVCAFDKSMTSFIARPPLFHVWCVNLAVLGTVGGGLASSAHEWLLQRLGAVIAQRDIAAVALGRCDLRPWHLGRRTEGVSKFVQISFICSNCLRRACRRTPS